LYTYDLIADLNAICLTGKCPDSDPLCASYLNPIINHKYCYKFKS
jgi:hypothetical protein